MKRMTLAAAGFVLAACGAISGPSASEIVATIQMDRMDFEGPIVIMMPDTVDATERFAVSVRTYRQCRRSEGRTDVAIWGLEATITPYTRVGLNCPDVLRVSNQTTHIRLEARGTAQVVVVGLSNFADTLRVERTVVVR